VFIAPVGFVVGVGLCEDGLDVVAELVLAAGMSPSSGTVSLAFSTSAGNQSSETADVGRFYPPRWR